MDGIPMPAAMADTDNDSAPRLSRLFEAHYDRLYRLARRLAGSREDALDLVQETFVRAARHLSAVPPGLRAEEAWLVRVLVNLQRDDWRKARVRDSHRDHVGPPAPAAHPEDARLANVVVWRAVGTLPPRRRAVVIMHELEGCSVADIASALGIRRVTVRWHLFRGRAELAAALDAPGRTR